MLDPKPLAAPPPRLPFLGWTPKRARLVPPRATEGGKLMVAPRKGKGVGK